MASEEKARGGPELPAGEPFEITQEHLDVQGGNPASVTAKSERTQRGEEAGGAAACWAAHEHDAVLLGQQHDHDAVLLA